MRVKNIRLLTSVVLLFRDEVLRETRVTHTTSLQVLIIKRTLSMLDLIFVAIHEALDEQLSMHIHCTRKLRDTLTIHTWATNTRLPLIRLVGLYCDDE
jgi:hypothetical protein